MLQLIFSSIGIIIADDLFTYSGRLFITIPLQVQMCRKHKTWHGNTYLIRARQ